MSRRVAYEIKVVLEDNPATGYPEIADRINNHFYDGLPRVDRDDVMMGVWWTKEHCHELGYTIPPCKKGPITAKPRLFILPLTAQGEYYSVTDIRDGTISTMASAASQAKHLNDALKGLLTHMRNPGRRSMLRSMIASVTNINEQAALIAEEMREERDNIAA